MSTRTYLRAVPSKLLPKMPLDLERVRTLEEFDGPLLIEFREKSTGHTYLWSWCDCSNTQHRWKVYRVEPDRLQAYLDGTLDMLSLVMGCPDPHVLLVDMDKDFNPVVREALLADLPPSYLPKAGCLYDPDLAPDG